MAALGQGLGELATVGVRQVGWGTLELTGEQSVLILVCGMGWGCGGVRVAVAVLVLPGSLRALPTSPLVTTAFRVALRLTPP